MLSVNCKQLQEPNQDKNNSKLLKVNPKQNSQSQNPSRLHNNQNPGKKKLLRPPNSR
jgi:hypothetical protein